MKVIVGIGRSLKKLCWKVTSRLQRGCYLDNEDLLELQQEECLAFLLSQGPSPSKSSTYGKLASSTPNGKDNSREFRCSAREPITLLEGYTKERVEETMEHLHLLPYYS